MKRFLNIGRFEDLKKKITGKIKLRRKFND